MLGDYLITDELTVKQTIEIMERNLIKAVLIVDDNNRVKGLFSNGDMRKYFLKGGKLSDNITLAMNTNPQLYRSRLEVEEEHENIHRVIYPIIDGNGSVIEVIDYGRVKEKKTIDDSLKDVPLVIMAGGMGTRLYPYTKVLPKPLIPIGDYTITERIIEQFQKFGCQQVYMILNYKANMIRAYMNDIDKNYKVNFVEEDSFLGTAGGLKLLEGIIHDTFFVSNCDVIINADLECIYKTHKQRENKITFVCSMKDIEIPYGIVETHENGFVSKIIEKPGFSFLVNTGLYMIEPEVLEDIGCGEYIHLPELAQRYLDKGEKVGVFPISEKSWMDMGQFSEMDNMLKQYGIK